MKNNSITMWFGNRGTKLDEFGNVYSVSRNVMEDVEQTKPDIISLYQSILRDIGLSVEVNSYEVFDPMTSSMKMRVIHSIYGIPTPLPFRRNFGYEYMKD